MARAGLGLAREGVTSRDDGCRNLVGNPSSFLPRRGPTSGRSGKFPFFFSPPLFKFLLREICRSIRILYTLLEKRERSIDFFEKFNFQKDS